MNLFNKKLLNQQIARFEFPSNKDLEGIQQRIKNWQTALKDSDLNKTKEVSIQGDFLTNFFHIILGYAKQTEGKQEWNLIQEPTTEVDSQTADGSLGIFTKDDKKTLAVIELKDAKTSLDKKQHGRVGKMTPIEQAFNYLNKFDGCKWAIVSNFREIRIYSKMRGQGFYEKFDIIELHQEQEFKKFFYILNKTNLIDDGKESVIEILAKNTTAQEENITKKFYDEYKEIRLKLLNHLFEQNPEIDNLILVEKTQKLLDRLIFTMACEDSSTLLPAHLIKDTYDRAFQSFAMSDSDQRVWTEFKGLFHAIDKGNKRVVPPINKYNGGLFKTDEVLDKLTIKDDIFEEIINLTEYDFESELNVNVLGHIFEQSISDLEEIREAVTLQFEDGSNAIFQDGSKIGLGQSKKKLVVKNGKRKKMGIFYTPEHITKYIIENTVGKYLEEHPKKLADIKILDPACGSGAFLNQTHSFLLNEYKIRTEEKQLEKTKKGEILTLWDTNIVENDKTILLNNLFGVDLNPESVEITKLAMWLKTAKATEPLQNLDNNIKCGNSLIDDPEIAGKRAFNWSKEFEKIMNKGGFDVIVGNPPYVYARENITSNEKAYYVDNYISAEYQLNTFVLFIEKSIGLLKKNGFLGFIIPNSILKIGSISKLRKLILEKTAIKKIVSLTGYSFDNVSVETVILILQKGSETNKVLVKNISASSDISSEKSTIINGKKWLQNKHYDLDIYISEKEERIIEKVYRKSDKLNNLFDVKAGLQAYEKGKGNPEQTADDVKSRPYDFDHQIDNNTYKYLEGKNISKNLIDGYSYWLKYGDNLAAPRTFNIFSRPRILIREITSTFPSCFKATYVDQTYLNNRSIINVLHPDDDKDELLFLLGLINSNLMSWYFTKTNPKANRSIFPKLILRDLSKFPICKTSDQAKKEITNKVNQILETTKKLFDEKSRLLEILLARLKLKQTTNLNNFHQLGWNEFVEEIEKQKIKMDLTEEDKLNKWFNKVRKQLLKLETKIQSLEQEIDESIYKIYELNTKEVGLIENAP